jgi:myo-inositol-1(or 4)-monophosphatase
VTTDQPPLPPAEELATIRAEAVRLAGEAGALAMDYFRRTLTVRYKAKDDRDPVTEADEASEKLLREGILARFPDHGIIGEESEDTMGDPNAPYLWVLDPVDGTANFLNGLALFSVSVGVLHEGRPVAGAIFVPSGLADAPAVVNAAASQGAAVGDVPIDRSLRTEARVRLGAVPGWGGGRWMRGRPPEGLRIGDARSLGSIAIELAFVATGTLQYAVFGGPRLWDVAAGALIAQEAGATALVRGRHAWSPLERFQPHPEATTKAEGYRRWAAPLIAGDDAAVRYIAGAAPRGGGVRRMVGRFLRG